MITPAPIRFTANVAAMREFFELLGFKSHIISEVGPDWVSMRGDVGIMSLHAADYEKSDVVFDTDEDMENLQKRLHDAGFSDARIVDEAFGRRLDVSDPQGENVMIFERMKDTYGYRVVE
ncbi:VOC family protein [Tenggerimyces flavus]|uniref:VOC family protein n=1 Tax=Tenggerimyces flavus TaxID=1708749 RepID=A0ABV7Y260_9ACTN|nr:hypothetical protein [Tenggerimyces flavus]MBM7790885.1 broad-specificity NMP kinase [Tenggerimyces flavus]